MVHPLGRRPRRICRAAGQRLDHCQFDLRQGRRRQSVQREIRRDVPPRRRHVEPFERPERLPRGPHLEFRALRRCRLGALLRQRHPRQRDRFRHRPAERRAALQVARPDDRGPLPARQPAFRRRERRTPRRRHALRHGGSGLQVQPPRFQACFERAADRHYALSQPDSGTRGEQFRTRLEKLRAERRE